MSKILEIHYLQNFAPSNLNRDDNGSPKEAYFGGTRRLRISSQSFKRAMRQDFKARQILTADELGHRTKRAHQEIARRLEKDGRSEAECLAAAELALSGIKLGVKDDKTQYLVFLGNDELNKVVEIINGSWENFKEAAPEPEAEAGAKKKKASKKVALSGDLNSQLLKALDGSKAVDVAMFGRMLADLPDKNTDAAVQVAHAISTHAMRERSFDFFTAVDDLKPSDTAAADMMGTVEFASATMYRYACIDLEKLLSNLQGDKELMKRGLEAFLYASVYSAPTGKQSTFAAHNHPSLMVHVVSSGTSPRNLANAFEQGIKSKGDSGYLAPSIEALAEEMKWQNDTFKSSGKTLYTSRNGNKAELGIKFDSTEDLIKATVKDAMNALGV